MNQLVDSELLETVSGKNKDHDLVLYALSTCGWCRKARNYLEDCDFEYRYVYVDLLEGDTLKDVVKEVEQYNPKKSFPTLIIDGDEVVAGFDKNNYAEKLK